jgi:hypothetical protein
MNGEEIIPTFSTSNINIGQCLLKPLTLAHLRSYKFFRKNQSVGDRGNSQLPPAKRCISAPAGKRDSSQGGSSVASTIPGQNFNTSSSLTNSGVADITQCLGVTPSATQRRSMTTATTMQDTSSRSTPAPEGTSQTDSTHRVVSSLASGIASTPTSLRGLENLPTTIPNPEARATSTNPVRTRATAKNWTPRQWQLQL